MESQLVYFALEKQTQTIKIGRSFKPVERIKTLNGMIFREMTLLGVMEGHERSIHRLFVDYKTEPARPFHEWFHAQPPLLDFIKRKTVPVPFAGRLGVKDPHAKRRKRKCVRCRHIQPVRQFRPEAVVCLPCLETNSR